MKKNISAVFIILVLAVTLNIRTFSNQPGNHDFVKLFHNDPNPFSKTTTVKFNITEDSNVRIFAVNKITGKRIDLVDGFVSAGEHGVIFKSPEEEKGEYTCTIQIYSSDNGTVLYTKELIMLKR